MTDQQDLRARLLEECDRKENIPTRVPTMNPRTRLVHSDRVRDLLREAAAKLGRVGEPVGYVHPDTIKGLQAGLCAKSYLFAKPMPQVWADVPLYTSPQLPAGVPDVELIDRIFNEEIKRVSTVEFDSNAICRNFYGEIRKRLVEQQPTPQPAQVGSGVDDDWHLKGYAYASRQATTCAGCGEHKHTPLRVDAMGGYVCLTCIDNKLGSLLGEFGHAAPQAAPVPEEGVVLVTVSGLTGTGKSAVAGEIEIMCRALRLAVEHDNQEERNMTHGDWPQALEMYKPKVRIVEVNTRGRANGTDD